eukprot:888549_1
MAQYTSKPPEDSELTEASLKAWQQLMQMGFDENISLDAVKRKGTNIAKCINYILKQNSNKKTPRKPQEEIKTDDTQTYKDRIDRVLRVAGSQEQDIYGLVEKEYAKNNGIHGFIADCGEYAMNIDSIYADNVNKCPLEQCKCIKRELDCNVMQYSLL